MDLQAEKLRLIQAILNIEDISVIKDIESLLKIEGPDWFGTISENQQQSVLQGLEQAERGETITHKEAIEKLGL
jgi:predicted transcriptional regulator